MVIIILHVDSGTVERYFKLKRESYLSGYSGPTCWFRTRFNIVLFLISVCSRTSTPMAIPHSGPPESEPILSLNTGLIFGIWCGHFALPGSCYGRTTLELELEPDESAA